MVAGLWRSCRQASIHLPQPVHRLQCNCTANLLQILLGMLHVQVLRKIAKEHEILEEGARAVVNGISNTVESDIKCAVLEERLAATDSKVRIMAAEDPNESYVLELDDI